MKKIPAGSTITTAYKPGKKECGKMWDNGACSNCECDWTDHVIAREYYEESIDKKVVNPVKEALEKDLGVLGNSEILLIGHIEKLIVILTEMQDKAKKVK